MKSVLIQEFRLHYKRVLFTVALMAGLYVLSGVLFALAEPESKLFNTAMGLSSLTFNFGTIGLFLWALFKGSGYVGDLIFKDTGYLMKTVPVSSWSLIGGKMVIGLLEFFVYCVLWTVYVFIVGLSIDVDFYNVFEVISLSEVRKNLLDFFNLAGCVLVFFIICQAVVNCAITIFYSVCRHSKWSGLLMGIFVYLFIWFTIKLFGIFVNFINFDFFRDAAELWIPMGILFLISVVYYVVTCILYEKKISV